MRLIEGPDWLETNGGRPQGVSRDCVCRSIAIASGKKWSEVADLIKKYAAFERKSKRKRGRSSPTNGVYKPTINKVCTELGAVWVPVMGIGTGCKMHVRRGELPTQGRYVLSLSRHCSALVDGVIHDTHDPSRGGTRCVYGYWRFP